MRVKLGRIRCKTAYDNVFEEKVISKGLIKNARRIGTIVGIVQSIENARRIT